MRKFKISFAICCLIAGMHTAALGCEALYDPATNVADIPCVEIAGTTQSFSVSLQWSGGNNFVLTSSTEYDVVNPPVSGLRILTTTTTFFPNVAVPITAVLIYGWYMGCDNAYGRPSYVLLGNNMDITLKAQRSRRADVGCTAEIHTFVEIVKLPNSPATQSYTYSVNGESIVPSY